MNELNAFCATSVDVPITDEITLTLSPLTFADKGALSEWTKTRLFDLAIQDLQPKSSKERLEIWRELRNTLNAEEVYAILTSPEGLIKQIWYAARKNDATMTIEMLSELLDDENKIIMCINAIDSMEKPAEEEAKNASTPKKKTSAQK